MSDVVRRLVALVAVMLVTGAAVFGGIERGNRLYRGGQYEEAVEAYRAALGTRSDGPVLRYNLGTALLRLGRYAEAEEYLRGALAEVDADTRGVVQYNLGQRFLEEARSTDDPAASAALYDSAVEAYRHALRQHPGDVDAKWNYELALQERDDQATGGDGGEDEEQEQEPEPREDGEGDGLGSPGRGDATPTAGEGADHTPMSVEEAERILAAMEQDERELLQDRLRQGRRETPAERDW